MAKACGCGTDKLRKFMKHYIELNSRGNIVTNIILNKAS